MRIRFGVCVAFVACGASLFAQAPPAVVRSAELRILAGTPQEEVKAVRAGEQFVVAADVVADGVVDPQGLSGVLMAVIQRQDGTTVICQSSIWRGTRVGANKFRGAGGLNFWFTHPKSSVLLRIGGQQVQQVALEVAPPAKSQYVRFQKDDTTAYGVIEGSKSERVRALKGTPFEKVVPTEQTYPISEVKLLPPTVPTHVLALAGNYKSHIKDAVVPEKFKIPQPFFKSPSCLIADGETIVIPKDSPGPVHYEAELVLVIGRKCKRVSKEKALEYVFGVTCGNDVSERYWQSDETNKDVQWWRAKGADTFGPVGPVIATGLNPDDLLVKLKLNGETKQEERTSQFIQDCATTVSFISQHITLHPGDLIFTGTPGKTEAIKPGDTVEVEIEGIGVLKNKVAKEE